MRNEIKMGKLHSTVPSAKPSHAFNFTRERNARCKNREQEEKQWGRGNKRDDDARLLTAVASTCQYDTRIDIVGRRSFHSIDENGNVRERLINREIFQIVCRCVRRRLTFTVISMLGVEKCAIVDATQIVDERALVDGNRRNRPFTANVNENWSTAREMWAQLEISHFPSRRILRIEMVERLLNPLLFRTRVRCQIAICMRHSGILVRVVLVGVAEQRRGDADTRETHKTQQWVVRHREEQLSSTEHRGSRRQKVDTENTTLRKR